MDIRHLLVYSVWVCVCADSVATTTNGLIRMCHKETFAQPWTGVCQRRKLLPTKHDSGCSEGFLWIMCGGGCAGYGERDIAKKGYGSAAATRNVATICGGLEFVG